MVDLASLASSVTEVVVPALPLLLQVADHAAQQTGKRVADGAFDLAKRMWDRLQGSEPARRKLKRTAEAIADQPETPGLHDAFKSLLEGALAEDSKLAKELTMLLPGRTPRSGSVAIGDMRGVGVLNTGTIGGSVTGRGDAGS
jgi:hypothetical protein